MSIDPISAPEAVSLIQTHAASIAETAQLMGEALVGEVVLDIHTSDNIRTALNSIAALSGSLLVLAAAMGLKQEQPSSVRPEQRTPWQPLAGESASTPAPPENDLDQMLRRAGITGNTHKGRRR